MFVCVLNCFILLRQLLRKGFRVTGKGGPCTNILFAASVLVTLS